MYTMLFIVDSVTSEPYLTIRKDSLLLEKQISDYLHTTENEQCVEKSSFLPHLAIK